MVSGFTVLEDSLSRFLFFGLSTNVVATFNENLKSDGHDSSSYTCHLFYEHKNLQVRYYDYLSLFFK